MMENQDHPGTLSKVFLLVPRSDSKITGEKRAGHELEQKHELPPKRVKIRDLDLVIGTDESSTCHSKPTKSKEVSDQVKFGGEDMSHLTEVPATLYSEASESVRTRKDGLPVEVSQAPTVLDLNAEVCIATNLAYSDSQKCVEVSEEQAITRKHHTEPDNNCLTQTQIGVDLNTDDVSSSVNHDSLCSFKSQNHAKSRDVSECGSSTGPLEEKDPLRVWKEMKQNGFLSSRGGTIVSNCVLSSSHGGIPVPKPRGRKCKNNMLKKKIELAKREQVDRFTKIAAPSGLLNELNPGIINHVRNRKQVHSIIEALVRSEKPDNCHSGSKQASNVKSETKDIGNRKDQENMNDSGIRRSSFFHEDMPLNMLSESGCTRAYSMAMNKSVTSISEEKSGDGDSSMVDTVSEDDTLALKLSSSTKVFENASSFSNEESGKFTSATSVAVEAATVASQWLELLHQDIKGRLSALRRSKKRVRAVITTELPFLISKEFSSNQENDPSAMTSSTSGFSNDAANGHQARWTMLFDQMDKALSEEEKQLENWLNQVKEMQLQCDQGLQNIDWSTSYSFEELGILDPDSRSGKADSSEKELAVKAAAASIYATCDFLLSKENVSCF